MSTGRLQDPVAVSLWDQMMGRSKDVLGTSVETHYNREDYHKKHPSEIRRPDDVPRRFPKGPNIWDLQGTFRGLSGDQYKH